MNPSTLYLLYFSTSLYIIYCIVFTNWIFKWSTYTFFLTLSMSILPAKAADPSVMIGCALCRPSGLYSWCTANWYESLNWVKARIETKGTHLQSGVLAVRKFGETFVACRIYTNYYPRIYCRWGTPTSPSNCYRWMYPYCLKSAFELNDGRASWPSITIIFL